MNNGKNIKKLLIGGQALLELGSSRGTADTDYLVNDTTTTEMFIKDEAANVDYINANGHKFFSEVWGMEEGNEGAVASPLALIELKAFSFVQHCLNMNWKKADEAEFDMKFLVRTFGVKPSIAKKYVTAGEWSEVEKVINSTKI